MPKRTEAPTTRSVQRPQLTLPRQSFTAEGPHDQTGMYVMHHAFRRDLVMFADAAAATPASDRDTWDALAERWRIFSRVLHHHHSGEDAGLWPRLMREVKPNYTADAMRAQVEGLVELEILVLEDGSVGNVRIVRSLDSRFGLDQEAINAVRRWRFDPGRRLGKAVATRVGVELSFNLR